MFAQQIGVLPQNRLRKAPISKRVLIERQVQQQLNYLALSAHETKAGGAS